MHYEHNYCHDCLSFDFPDKSVSHQPSPVGFWEYQLLKLHLTPLNIFSHKIKMARNALDFLDPNHSNVKYKTYYQIILYHSNKLHQHIFLHVIGI